MLQRLRDKNLHTWMRGYTRHLIDKRRQRRAPSMEGPRHLLFALCDHYEPLWARPSPEQGRDRVDRWHQQYPQLVDRFRDANGRTPRHSFFFPGEEYRPEFLLPLADLVRRGYGEVEVHHHHDGDTAANLRGNLERYLRAFAEHGHISRDASGRYQWAFIHGNWCLANARRDGRWCGVDEELPLLFDAGCYADFTFPAAPDESQPDIVNQIYWPTGDLHRRRAYESGERARVGKRMDDRLLMIQGPIALARRPGSLKVRIESAALDAVDTPSPARLRTWVEQNIHVAGRPEWLFVKVHTHGAPEANAATLLGDGGRTLHDVLTRTYNDGVQWKLHYVTAREMYNVALAAMDGHHGDPAAHFDYHVAPPPIARA